MPCSKIQMEHLTRGYVLFVFYTQLIRTDHVNLPYSHFNMELPEVGLLQCEDYVKEVATVFLRGRFKDTLRQVEGISNLISAVISNNNNVILTDIMVAAMSSIDDVWKDLTSIRMLVNTTAVYDYQRGSAVNVNILGDQVLVIERKSNVTSKNWDKKCVVYSSANRTYSSYYLNMKCQVNMHVPATYSHDSGSIMDNSATYNHDSDSTKDNRVVILPVEVWKTGCNADQHNLVQHAGISIPIIMYNTHIDR